MICTKLFYLLKPFCSQQNIFVLTLYITKYMSKHNFIYIHTNFFLLTIKHVLLGTEPLLQAVVNVQFKK